MHKLKYENSVIEKNYERKKIRCNFQNLITQNLTKHKKSNCDNNQNSNCDKTQKLNFLHNKKEEEKKGNSLKNHVVTKLKNFNFDKA